MLRLVLAGLMGALLVVSKQAMSSLPNIEPVTLLIILFALEKNGTLKSMQNALNK